MLQSQALSILKTGANVFLTGEPGAGKTYTINEYVTYLRAHGVEVTITASTGIAATHIGGMTIHSWSGIGIHEKLSARDLNDIATRDYVVRRVERAAVLIIDEVSMLPTGTLVMVDAVCQKIRRNAEPFGGLQVIFVGDFFQLPPITKISAPTKQTQTQLLEVAPEELFAFNSPVWTAVNPVVCYLSEQHRQNDQNFLDVLAAIRTNSFNGSHRRHLETRKTSLENAPTTAPKLFSHNANVDALNEQTLETLAGAPKCFTMATDGHPTIVAMLVKSCLSPEKLYLKIGARVMCTKNNPREDFVNGTLGKIVGFDADSGYPEIVLTGGKKMIMTPMSWTVEDRGRELARITQLPLRLAWAITVHKSQGMSMDAAVMDLSKTFEYGQGYVALSRVRTLAGLHLLGWNERTFEVHPQVLEKDAEFRAASEKAIARLATIPATDLQKRHDDFILSADGKLSQPSQPHRPEKKSKPGGTHLTTLALWNAGKNCLAIAAERELTEKTILNHIEKLVVDEKIPPLDIMSRLVSPELNAALPEIKRIFFELDTNKLTPVFEKLNGRYSYRDLTIARMLLAFL